MMEKANQNEEKQMNQQRILTYLVPTETKYSNSGYHINKNVKPSSILYKISKPYTEGIPEGKVAYF